MIKLDLKKACREVSGKLDTKQNPTFVGVSIDTRTLIEGNLFVAIVGEQLDGHDYLTQAKQAGAVAAIVEKHVDIDLPQIIVKDTTQAIGELAFYWRHQFSIPIVGITGSCGKTTTTRMIAAILSQVGNTLYPDGNKNNQWGVPLTLFRLSEQHQYAVIEMGADRGGEIRYLAHIVRPDIAVLTCVAPVHLVVREGVGFGSIEGVFSEKTEIFRALGEYGFAIVNADDHYYPQWRQMLGSHNQVSFGFSSQANVTAAKLTANDHLQYQFNLVTPKGNIDIQLSSIGKHNVINALAASAVATALDIDIATIKQGLSDVPLVDRRMNRHQLANGAVIIDDSYNSNLKSAKAIIEMLTEHKGNKIAVLGDMAEIGEQSEQFHREVGEYAKQHEIDQLYCFGPESIAMAQAFGDNAQHYKSVDELVLDLSKQLTPKTMVAIKASLSVGIDRVVTALLNSQGG